MTRKKVKLAFVANDSARKATYKKRKRGLLKKMDELTTLCDVKACAILYSPYEAKPVVWPGASGARDVIGSYNRLPEMEKAKRMVTLDDFLRQRVAKAHEQLKRQQKENREKEMTQVMYECLSGKSIQNMSLLDLSDLGWVINQHLSDINKRVDAIKKENPSSNLIHNNNINNGNNHSTITTTNYNNSNNNNTNSNHHFVSRILSCQAVGPKEVGEGLRGHKEEFDAMQLQMMQPWSSFMDMMGPPMVLEHQHQHQHQHHHHQQQPYHGMGMGGGGLGNGVSGATSGSASSNNSNNYDINNNTSMMMMRMMGQFGEYQGQGVNPALWSNAFFS